jgi:hypothetical protein
MARRQALFQNLKSNSGVALIGLGIFILFGSLMEAGAELNHLTGFAAGMAAGEPDTPELLTTIGLAASRALQAYVFDHKELLRGLYQVLISFWPLLFVILGTLLLGNGFTDEINEPPKIDTATVDIRVPRSMRR